MPNCTQCKLKNLHLDFPTYDREVRELNAGASKSEVAKTLIGGTDIAITNMTLTHTNNNGLVLKGENIRVENALIWYTDWIGSLTYQPLGVVGNNITITKSTVAYFGNAGVVTSIPNTPPTYPNASTPPVPEPMNGRYLSVDHTHIHHGGLVGMDTALLYTGVP